MLFLPFFRPKHLVLCSWQMFAHNMAEEMTYEKESFLDEPKSYRVMGQRRLLLVMAVNICSSRTRVYGDIPFFDADGKPMGMVELIRF